MEQLTDKLDKEELDAAIMSSPNPFAKRFQTQTVFKENFVVAIPPNHRLSHKNSIKPGDIDGETYIYRCNCEYSEDIIRQLKDMNVGVNIKFWTHREDWVQTMILAGMGITFLPESMPIYGHLQTRPLTGLNLERSVVLAHAAEKQLGRAAIKFSAKIAEHVWKDSACAIKPSPKVA